MYTSHKQYQKTCSETFNSQREPVHSMGVEVTQPTCTYRQRVSFRAPQDIGDPRFRVFGFVHDLHGLFVDHPKGTVETGGGGGSTRAHLKISKIEKNVSIDHTRHCIQTSNQNKKIHVRINSTV